MKKKTVWVFMLCICITIVAAMAAFDDEASPLKRWGAAFRAAAQNDSDASIPDEKSIAARYGDFTVTWAEIRYQQTIAPMHTEEHYQTTDVRTIAERLIGGQLALEEAARQELTATDEEIQAFMKQNLENYDSMPEVREAVDSYCKGAELTTEEYFQMLEEQAGDTLTRNHFKAQFYEKWYAENPLGPGESPEAYHERRFAAYDAYIAELLAQHADEIEYYLPVEK